MRTEQEIRRAIGHFEEALTAANELEVAQLLPVLDVLRWCVGDPNDFEELMRHLDQVDEDRAKAERTMKV